MNTEGRVWKPRYRRASAKHETNMREWAGFPRGGLLGPEASLHQAGCWEDLSQPDVGPCLGRILMGPLASLLRYYQHPELKPQSLTAVCWAGFPGMQVALHWGRGLSWQIPPSQGLKITHDNICLPYLWEKKKIQLGKKKCSPDWNHLIFIKKIAMKGKEYIKILKHSFFFFFVCLF